jgi:hypothetical protein
LNKSISIHPSSNQRADPVHEAEKQSLVVWRTRLTSGQEVDTVSFPLAFPSVNLTSELSFPARDVQLLLRHTLSQVYRQGIILSSLRWPSQCSDQRYLMNVCENGIHFIVRQNVFLFPTPAISVIQIRIPCECFLLRKKRS